MAQVVYHDFGASSRPARQAVQLSSIPPQEGKKEVLQVGRRLQLPDGCLGNIEVVLTDHGIVVNFSNRHVDPVTYSFSSLVREIRRPRKGASVNGVIGFETSTPLEVFYCGKVICRFIAVDAELKQVTVQH